MNSEFWVAAATGAALSLGLVAAIGAQNAFVLRQGLRREHVGAIVGRLAGAAPDRLGSAP
jgi:L-lysine exporter family protein LysE/ArgO